MEIFVIGSSLNTQDRSFNDVDIMVTLDPKSIHAIKSDFLHAIWTAFQSRTSNDLPKYQNDTRISMLGLTQILKEAINAREFVEEILARDKEALMARTNSLSEVNRIDSEPATEIKSISTTLSGLMSQEGNTKPVDADGTQGYQFGPLVETFLAQVAGGLDQKDHHGTPLFGFHWNKSFSEGYDKTASENNLYIYTTYRCSPIHLWMATEMVQKKHYEKKESFMLEYYTEAERLPAVRLM